jgi:hypothetical protein
MAINLDAVPDKNPAGPMPEGTYKATIVKKEMKQPNDVKKPMYLEVKFDMIDTAGNAAGSFTDRFFESESSYLLFKLKRFIYATNLTLTGTVLLKDIEKVLGVGIAVVTVIKHSENTWNGQTRMQAEVDLFNSDCYYPGTEWSKFKGDADDPFNKAETEATEDGQADPVPENTDNKY